MALFGLSYAKSAGKKRHCSSYSRPVKRFTYRALASALLLALYLTGNATLADSIITENMLASPEARPVVLRTANGLPQIEIQTPNDSGISMNEFSQFDVGQPGAILNNSRSGNMTQLGGYVPGNPYLARGEADVIVNQINSNNPSKLNAYIEVAGRRADVVIANPSGIAVNGGGMINANKVILSTGQTEIHNGEVIGHNISQGKISISGKGLDTQRTDYTALLTRSAEINAGIYQGDGKLEIVTGNNRIDADGKITKKSSDSAKPQVAIDSGHLGGMYAGSIRLISTDKGVGVNHGGQIHTGSLDLNIDGQLNNSGTLFADKISISAEKVSNTNEIKTGQFTVSGQLLTNEAQGRIEAEHLALTLEELDNKGKLYQTSNISLDISTQQLANTGMLSDDVKNKKNAASESRESSSPSEVGYIRVTDKLINSGQLLSGGDIYLSSTEFSNRGNIKVTELAHRSGLFDNQNAQITAQKITIDNRQFENTDGVIVADTFKLNTGQANNERGKIDAKEAVIAAGSFNNDSGQLTGQRLFLTVNELSNRQGKIAAKDTGAHEGSIVINFDHLDNSGGLIAAPSVALTGSSLLTNDGGEIVGNNNLLVQDSGKQLVIDNSGGRLSGKSVSLASKSLKGIENISAENLKIYLQDDFVIDKDLEVIGQLELGTQGNFIDKADLKGQTVSLSALQDLKVISAEVAGHHGTTLRAGGNIAIGSGSSAGASTVRTTGKGNTRIHAGGIYSQYGSVVDSADGNVDIMASSLNIASVSDSHTTKTTTVQEEQGTTVEQHSELSRVTKKLDNAKSYLNQSKEKRINHLAEVTVDYLSQLQQSASADKDQSTIVRTFDKQTTTTTETHETYSKPSSITASGKVSLTTAGGKDSFIRINGSDVIGQGGTELRTDGRIELSASANRRSKKINSKMRGTAFGIELADGEITGAFSEQERGNKLHYMEKITPRYSRIGSKDSDTVIMAGSFAGRGAEVLGKTIETNVPLKIEHVSSSEKYSIDEDYGKITYLGDGKSEQANAVAIQTSRFKFDADGNTYTAEGNETINRIQLSGEHKKSYWDNGMGYAKLSGSAKGLDMQTATGVINELKAQVEVTKIAGQWMPYEIAQYAEAQMARYEKAQEIIAILQPFRNQALSPEDSARLNQLLEKAEAIVADKENNYDAWQEGGEKRVKLHTKLGYMLTGTEEGAKAAATVAALSPKLREIRAGLGEEQQKLFDVNIGTIIGEMAGGEAGKMAANIWWNNENLHQKGVDLASKDRNIKEYRNKELRRNAFDNSRYSLNKKDQPTFDFKHTADYGAGARGGHQHKRSFGTIDTNIDFKKIHDSLPTKINSIDKDGNVINDRPFKFKFDESDRENNKAASQLGHIGSSSERIKENLIMTAFGRRSDDVDFSDPIAESVLDDFISQDSTGEAAKYLSRLDPDSDQYKNSLINSSHIYENRDIYSKLPTNSPGHDPLAFIYGAIVYEHPRYFKQVDRKELLDTLEGMQKLISQYNSSARDLENNHEKYGLGKGEAFLTAVEIDNKTQTLTNNMKRFSVWINREHGNEGISDPSTPQGKAHLQNITDLYINTSIARGGIVARQLHKNNIAPNGKTTLPQLESAAGQIDKDAIIRNIAASQKARQSSNFGEHVKREQNLNLTRQNAGNNTVNGSSTQARPTPFQSERDVGASLGPNARPQVSYQNGVEVPYGTRGSVRPDFCVGPCSIEVKNYSIANNKHGLINNVTKQAVQRQQHLPQGMTQKVTIDVRGQSYTAKDLDEIRLAIVQKTNGIISANNIEFKR